MTALSSSSSSHPALSEETPLLISEAATKHEQGFSPAKKRAIVALVTWCGLIPRTFILSSCCQRELKGQPVYTATAFDQMRPFPVPVRTALTLLTSIKQSVPRAERIWKASSIWRGGVGERFAKLLEAERVLRQGLDAGKWTLDTTVEETGVKIP